MRRILLTIAVILWGSGVWAQQPVQILTGQSGTNVTVDGTITVTDGAGALNVIVDSGTITAVTTITNAVTVTDGSGALNVIVDSGSITASDPTFTDATGSAVPANAAFVAGTDGTNTRALKTDASGELQVDVLSMPTTTVTATNLDVQIGGSDTVTVTGTVTVTDGAGALNVICDSGCGGAATFEDNDAFTPNTTAVNIMAGEVDDTGTAAVTENSAGAVRMSARRELYGQIRDAAGNERGANVTASNALVVDGSAVTQPVSGTVTVTATNLDVQIGGSDTVTVTATNLDVQSGGGDLNLETTQASVLTSVQLIDDTIFTSGTSTYTEATSKNQLLGAVRRDADTTLVDTTNEIGPLQMDANGRLKVEVFSGEALPVTLTSTTITGTVAVTQSGTWDEVGINDSGNSITVDGTVTVTDFSTVFGSDAIFGTAGTADADVMTIQGVASMTPVLVNPGTATNFGVYVEDVAETAGSNMVVTASVRRDTAATSAGASGEYATFNTDSVGALWTRTTDPCSAPKTFVAVNQTTGTQLFAGTASNRTYICHINIVTATAQNIALVSGTGTVCATSTGPIMGGTTAATGWNFAANGGISAGDGNGSIGKSDTDADNICILQSGSGQISGVVAYVVAAN